jgi:glycosyltransferase involved in cell wall biosynthesis
MKISVIAPAMNEEESISEFVYRTSKTCELFEDYELIIVDDGSTDGTWGLIEKFSWQNPKIKGLRLTRNFGHQFAVLAGISNSHFEIVCVIDADLQDPPELIFEMAQDLGSELDIIYGKRIIRKGESVVKKLTAELFYWLMSKLTPINMPLDVGDFRVVTRRAADAVLHMNEPEPFLRGLFAYTGYRAREFSYIREKRFAGKTKYPFKKMIKFGVNAFFSFSDIPYKLFVRFSFLLLSISLIVAFYAFVSAYVNDTSPGWLSLFSAIIFFGSLNMFYLTILGKYILLTLKSIQNRPKWIIQEKCPNSF